MTALWDNEEYVGAVIDNWRTSEREQDSLLFIEKLVRRPPLSWVTHWGRVLDVGCGDGRFGDLFYNEPRKHEIYVGIDSSPLMVEQALLRGVDARLGSVYHLPFITNPYITDKVQIETFDLVLCHAVLFHIADIPAALKELWRVTGKRLIFSCYYTNGLRHKGVELVPSEDKARGKMHVSTRNVIPRWMLKRLVGKLRGVKKKKFHWQPPYKKGSTPYVFVVLEK